MTRLVRNLSGVFRDSNRSFLGLEMEFAATQSARPEISCTAMPPSAGIFWRQQVLYSLFREGKGGKD